MSVSHWVLLWSQVVTLDSALWITAETPLCYIKSKQKMYVFVQDLLPSPRPIS